MAIAIETYRDRVVNTIDSNRVTIVVGATGSGKSTFVPLWLADSLLETRRVLCVQPRRVAATQLAHRVSSLLGDPSIGGRVGVRMRGYVCDSADTQIVYATAGYMRALLGCDQSFLDNISHIVLDEVHERSLDSDFLSLMVRMLLAQPDRFARIKLVVMSATISTGLFQEYFRCLSPDDSDIAVVHIQTGTPYTITTRYLEDCLEGSSKYISECAQEVLRDQECLDSLSNLDHKDSLLDLVASLVMEHAKDSFVTLVFLPGESAIEATERKLLLEIPTHELVDREDSVDADSTKRYYQIHILHSLVPIEEQRRALKKPTAAGGRHIVLATNIAESSLTVEAVNLVIDLGLKRSGHFDSVNKISSLRTAWASKASTTQRSGRTGRVCDGTVIRLFSREIERKFMPDYEVPEATLANPSVLFLSAKLVCDRWKSTQSISPTELIGNLISFIDKPGGFPASLIRSTVEELHASGVLLSNSENSPLTLFGSLATWLELDPGIAKIVFLSLLLDLPAEGIVLATAASTEKDMFMYAPKLQPWKETRFSDRVFMSMRNRIMYDGGFASDLIMVRNLLVSWLTNKARYTADGSGEYVKSAPLHTSGVFLSEFHTFLVACTRTALSVLDWIEAHAGGALGGVTAGLRRQKNRRSSPVKKSAIDAMFAQLMEGSLADESTGNDGGASDDGSDTLRDVASKLKLFSEIVSPTSRNRFSHKDLSSLFLPLARYTDADILKFILTVSLGGGDHRVLVADAGFPRAVYDAYTIEGRGAELEQVKDIATIISGGKFEPKEVRRDTSKTALVLSASDEWDDALVLPYMSEYSCVTASPGIRMILSIFDKSWKADIGVPKSRAVVRIRKPYIYNVCRWHLPVVSKKLTKESIRVYISAKNPTGWLETTSGVFSDKIRHQIVESEGESEEDSDGGIEERDDGVSAPVVGENRNSDHRRKWLSKQFFAVTVNLISGNSNSGGPASVVRAQHVTVLPIRCCGRPAVAMLLAAIPLAEGTVRHRFSVDEMNGDEFVQVVPGSKFLLNPSFPVWEDMVVLLDSIRQIINTATTSMPSGIAQALSEAHELRESVSALFSLANMDEVTEGEYPDGLEPTHIPRKVIAIPLERAQVNPAEDRLNQLRMQALAAEVDFYMSREDGLSPTVSDLWEVVSTVWDIYETFT